MINTNRFKKLFEIYCHFFHIENQVSIIDGRSFDLIFLFQNELERILFGNETTKYDELLTACNTYNKEMSIEYKTHSYTDCNKINVIHETIFDNIFDEEFIELLKYFYQSYEQLTIYTNELMNDVLLIEFNDMLAHILVALINSANTTNFKQNVSRAKTHIYRATLDGYKEIIVGEAYRSDATSHIVPHDIKKELFTTRLKEIKSIGENITSRFEYIQKYANLACRLINLGD